ncbi:MAG: A/G-specific adenine glycosylase [Rhodospirillaceae bacterium]|nr:MAG: A/G-specific adenine glycosylase [Rhodospirillaceae bacterium]
MSDLPSRSFCSTVVDRLLTWYDQGHRALPWRAEPHETPNPYRVWLSEVMLQQTTVSVVKPYFHAFITRWPTLADLAQATLEDVLAAWAGLGYYARARNLHQCAQEVAFTGNGTFPTDTHALQRLPGIGAYTAAAMTAIAFGRRAVAVDGNIERVLARLFAVTDFLPAARSHIRILADALTPENRCGDFIQAVMDLGATLCTPRQPACMLCPLQRECVGFQQGLAATLPARAGQSPHPIHYGIAFFVLRKDGAVLLRRRPPKGLLGGMMEVPSTPWRDDFWTLEEAVAAAAPLSLEWHPLPGTVRHVFTHFRLDMRVVMGEAGSNPAARGIWSALDRMDEQALPSVMRKILVHAIRFGM